jgi:hypothetical protein
MAYYLVKHRDFTNSFVLYLLTFRELPILSQNSLKGLVSAGRKYLDDWTELTYIRIMPLLFVVLKMFLSFHLFSRTVLVNVAGVVHFKY